MQRRQVLAAGVLALAGCADSSDDGPGDGTEFSQEPVETVFLERFNAMRREHSVATVDRNRDLSDMGQSHAENMAEQEYIGHTQPDGTTIEQRFADRGLDCELPVEGSNEYYPAAENVATAAEGRVEHPGSDETFFVRTNDDLAEFLMDSWMHSEGHREVMVLPSVREIGLGVATNGSDIYAALEFC